MRPAPMRKMVSPVTMGGKHRLSMRGGMKDSSTASQQQVICNHKISVSHDEGFQGQHVPFSCATNTVSWVEYDRTSGP